MAQMVMYCDTVYNLADSITLGGNAFFQRDYLQGRLYNKLDKDQAYCVSFYVVLEYGAAFAVNHIGAYFDDGTIDTTNWCGLVQTTHTPQVVENTIITDTLNWTKVEGTFIADGTENFITIGNFTDKAHTDKLCTYFPAYIYGDNLYYSNYLVDDISVIPLNANADAGPDRWVSSGSDSVWVGDTTGYLPCLWYANGVLIDSNIAGLKVHPTVNTSYTMVLDVCGRVTSDTAMVFVAPVGVNAVTGGMDINNQNYQLYPNPNNGSYELSQFILDVNPVNAAIYNEIGTLVTTIKIQFNGYTAKVQPVNLPPGLYLIRLTNSQNHSFNYKFIKE